MKKILFLTAIFSLLAISSLAQNKADFSGNWELDTVKSKLDERMRVESMTMNVAQTQKELKVETGTKRALQTDDGTQPRVKSLEGKTVVYSLEGKETKAEVGSGMMAGTATLKASLNADGKLKLSSTRDVNTEMGAVTIKTNETWELADEGKTLKVSRTMETPRGTNSWELIFIKRGDIAVVKREAAASTSDSVSDSTTPKPKIISGGVVNGKAKNLVKPEYPNAARAVRASGAVNVQVTIDENGDVISAQAVSGHPLLRGAAVDAAKKSKFAPVSIEGTPVKVTGIIVFNFVP